MEASSSEVSITLKADGSAFVMNIPNSLVIKCIANTRALKEGEVLFTYSADDKRKVFEPPDEEPDAKASNTGRGKGGKGGTGGRGGKARGGRR